ncbi:NAD(P)-binding protein [Algiphilus sp. W345]|uniref:NAD(P)-binding protein n=1 Tax=Banduia mediterranea TaxID=3075609 RepID=A0ABU2WKP6_9GAMM|nr:NAD(P)-binding protein [Algiphilus sp. W345]MDT0498455.1 NAD(P)-binding protein [Algiphilus sp. W345]
MRIAILGGGFGGIGAAIKLSEAGYEAITIFEKASDVGGCWRDNSYPVRPATCRPICTRSRSNPTRLVAKIRVTGGD